MSELGQRLSSKREQSLAVKRKEKLRNDLFNKFGIGAIDIIDKMIARHADAMLAKEPYMKVVDTLAECITHPEPHLTGSSPPVAAAPVHKMMEPAANGREESYVAQDHRTPILYSDEQPLLADRKVAPAAAAIYSEKDWGEMARRNDQMSLVQIEQEMAEEAAKKLMYRYSIFGLS